LSGPEFDSPQLHRSLCSQGKSSKVKGKRKMLLLAFFHFKHEVIASADSYFDLGINRDRCNQAFQSTEVFNLQFWLLLCAEAFFEGRSFSEVLSEVMLRCARKAKGQRQNCKVQSQKFIGFGLFYLKIDFRG
jgi:hypothetical protein